MARHIQVIGYVRPPRREADPDRPQYLVFSRYRIITPPALFYRRAQGAERSATAQGDASEFRPKDFQAPPMTDMPQHPRPVYH